MSITKILTCFFRGPKSPKRPQTVATFVVRLAFNKSATSAQAVTTVVTKSSPKMIRRKIRKMGKKRR